MDIQDLRPKVFRTHPETDDAKRQWLHWFKSFTTYINKLGEVSVEDKLNLLIKHVDATVYKLFSEAPDYDVAINLLTNTYARAPCPIFARYALKQWSPNFSSRGPCIDFFGPPRAKARD